VNSIERHAVLIEHGWRSRVDGKWISPHPEDARFAFSFTAAWAQHSERENEAGFLVEPAPDRQSANFSRDLP
jgi:hypothetical protein